MGRAFVPAQRIYMHEVVCALMGGACLLELEKKKYFKVCVQTRVGKKQDTSLVGLVLLKNRQNSF